MDIFQHKVMDIEDWYKEASEEKFCAFYATRSMLPNANVIVLTFENITDEKSLELIKPHLQNSIVVIEDADIFENHLITVS